MSGDAEALAGILRATVADLDGYIGRRAAELAAPMVAAALADAGARTRAAAFAVQRRDDVIAEFRRRVRVVDRMVAELEQWRQAAGCQTPAELQRANAPGLVSEGDDLANAVRIVVTGREASPGLLQRSLYVGYARAARYIDDLITLGVVSPPRRGKDGPRWDVLTPEGGLAEALEAVAEYAASKYPAPASPRVDAASGPR